jgi:DNA/RNA-binding domain of Phe-tRNA-synthetase-like protein
LPDRSPELRLSEEVTPLLRVGLVRAEPVAVGPSSAALLGEMDRTGGDLAREHAGRSPSEIPGLGPARDLYRAFRIDPTRTRPSSEALLRRILQGKPLPRILSAVDLCNLLSLRFLLPLGLYDAERISGEVTLRRGRPSESYPGIRKEEVHLEGRPVLSDAEGPFGNPTSDSLRTSVTAGTRSLWLMIFAPADFSRATLEAYAGRAGEEIRRHLAPAGKDTAIRLQILP